MDVRDSLKDTAETQAKGVFPASMLAEGASVHARAVGADIWCAVRNDRQVQFMLLVLVVSLLCWNVPMVSFIFYPFKIVVSFLGQTCAILVARLTAGTVQQLVIDPAGGTSSFSGGNPLLIANAAALGTSLIGGTLIWRGRTPQGARFALRLLGTAMLVLALFYADADVLRMIGMILTTVAVLAVSARASEKVCHILLLIIAVQCTLAGLLKAVAFVALSASSEHGREASTMESITGVPALVWALLWGAVSASILLFAFWISYRPSKIANCTEAVAVASQLAEGAKDGH